MIDGLVWNVCGFRIVPIIAAPFPIDSISFSDKSVRFAKATAFHTSQHGDIPMREDFAKPYGVHAARHLQSRLFVGPKAGMSSGNLRPALAHGRSRVHFHAAFPDCRQQRPVSSEDSQDIVRDRSTRTQEYH